MSGTFTAFDFGTKSIGVAIGQRVTGTARALPAIKAQDGTPDWNLIERLLKSGNRMDHRWTATEYGRHRATAHRPRTQIRQPHSRAFRRHGHFAR